MAMKGSWSSFPSVRAASALTFGYAGSYLVAVPPPRGWTRPASGRAALEPERPGMSDGAPSRIGMKELFYG